MFKHDAEFNDMIKNIQGSTEDLLSYQEPGRSQTEWKRKINRCQHWDDRKVKIIYQRFLKAIKRKVWMSNYKHTDSKW